MKHEIRILRRLGLVLSLLPTLTVGCTLVIGRTSTTPPAGPHAYELLLDERAFPQDWRINPCAPDCGRDEGENQAARTFVHDNPTIPGHVLQDVFRLGSVEDAQAKFQTYREVDFRKREPPQVPSTALLPPSEFSYRSLVADDFYLGCGVDIVPVCRVIARYRNYFVHLHIDVDKGEADGLQIDEVEPVLHALDKLVAARLGIPVPTERSSDS